MQQTGENTGKESKVSLSCDTLDILDFGCLQFFNHIELLFYLFLFINFTWVKDPLQGIIIFIYKIIVKKIFFSYTLPT